MAHTSNSNPQSSFNAPVSNKQLPSYSIADIVQSVDWVELTTDLENDFLCVEAVNFQSELFKEPCRVDGVTVVMITEGQVQANINLQQVNMQAGEVIVNVPDNIVQIVQEDIGVSGVIMLISYELFQKIPGFHIEKSPAYVHLQKHPLFRPMDKDWKWLLEFSRNILYATNNYDGERKPEVILGLLAAFTQCLLDAAKTADFITPDSIMLSGNAHQNNVFEQFMTLLHEHHSQERTVQFYAAKLMFTPKYFSKLIREITGRSASDWITDFVMLEARHLLRRSDLSIKEVSYQLNFATPSLFARYFKKHAQCTPQEYRSGVGF